VHFTPLAHGAIVAAVDEWLQELRFSFGFIDWKDPRSIVLPLIAPFSMATLAAQAGARGLATLEAIGASRYLDFIKYCVQIFSEFPVYVGLEYGKIIARHQRWLDDHPEDSATRTELGRTLVKLGRFTEALEELSKAAQDGEAAGGMDRRRLGSRRADDLEQFPVPLDYRVDGRGSRRGRQELRRIRRPRWLA